MTNDLDSVIRQIAHDVYEELGSGHTETVYHRAMVVGLRLHKTNINYESGKVLELTYQGYYVGEGFADLLVGSGDDRIAVELKAVGQTMGKNEEQQLRNYMKVLKVTRGLLINFQHLSKAKSPKNPTKLEIISVNL